MQCCLFVVITVLCLNATAAPAADPASAPACRSALDALRAQENAALATRGHVAPAAAQHAQQAAVADPHWQALRHAAATACLGGADAAPAQRLAIPPIGMKPLTVGPARPPAAAPAPPADAPVRQLAPPATLSACDPTGCWASDGTRLQRAGPALLGPKGLCSSAGGVLHCP